MTTFDIYRRENDRNITCSGLFRNYPTLYHELGFLNNDGEMIPNVPFWRNGKWMLQPPKNTVGMLASKTMYTIGPRDEHTIYMCPIFKLPSGSHLPPCVDIVEYKQSVIFKIVLETEIEVESDDFMKCYVPAIRNLNWQFVGYSPMVHSSPKVYSPSLVLRTLDHILEISRDCDLITAALDAANHIQYNQVIIHILFWFIASGDAEPDDIDVMISTLSSIRQS
jgi:hypothetical protein